jgi:excisionase family DNA binding protein
MNSQKLETAFVVAAFLGVSPATIYSRAKRRLLPHYRIGDRILFDRDEVLAAIRQSVDESDDFKIPKIAIAGRR